MALEVINVGSVPNDGTGDPIRTAYIKCNNNFAEIFSRYQDTVPGTLWQAQPPRVFDHFGDILQDQ